MEIKDPIHGIITLTPLQNELISTSEVQRLNHVHQLGNSFQVYPAAHGMRFCHALGVSTIAGNIFDHVSPAVDLPDSEKKVLKDTVMAAGLLHDICHTPWSHTLEPLFIEQFGGNHMDIVEGILTGKRKMAIPFAGEIPGILKSFDVDPLDVGMLISKRYNKHPFLQQIIFGEVDADTLDYLKRDFYFTGVSFGHIDIERLVTIMTVKKEQLVFLLKGLPAMRDFLSARIEMFSAVYLHNKTRIVDLMMLKAARKSIVAEGEFPDWWTMTDDEFLSHLCFDSKSSYVNELACRIKYRNRLFKAAVQLRSASLTPEQQSCIDGIMALGSSALERQTKAESMISKISGVPKEYLIVDLPAEAVKISEERFTELNLVVLDKKGELKNIADTDRLFVDYLKRAVPATSAFSVYCPPEHITAVETTIEKFFQAVVEQPSLPI